MHILKEIDEIIMKDQLKPGDKLPSEREFAERLNVGRSSVREALRTLEILDLIETRRGEGTFLKNSGSERLVKYLAKYYLRDPKARQDVTETRRIIEVEAVRLACERITKEQEEKLLSFVQKSKERFIDGEIPVEEDYLFHKLLVESCHNRLLLNIWQPLVEYSKVAIEQSLFTSERTKNAVAEHEQIVAAIIEKDMEKAVITLEKHLENSRF